MMEKGKSFDLVRDVRGVRLICPRHCRLLCRPGHHPIPTGGPFPNEFDDYIAAPRIIFTIPDTAVIYDDWSPGGSANPYH